MSVAASGPVTREDIRAHGRGLLNVGYVACLLGAVVMLVGRFRTGAPPWLVYVGLSGIVFGWGLFAFVSWSRFALARRRAQGTRTKTVDKT